MKSSYMSLNKVYKELGLEEKNIIIWSFNPNLPTCVEKGIIGKSNSYFNKETNQVYTYRIKNYKK